MNDRERARLSLRLPGLEVTSFRITSPRDEAYNCIAWALGETERSWDPDEEADGYWPSAVPADVSIANIQFLFSLEGFEQCETSDPEPGIEKVALYATDREFTHVARQLPDGRWTSKLGEDCDIEHELEALVTPRSSFPLWRYGEVAAFMQRPRPQGSA